MAVSFYKKAAAAGSVPASKWIRSRRLAPLSKDTVVVSPPNDLLQLAEKQEEADQKGGIPAPYAPAPAAPAPAAPAPVEQESDHEPDAPGPDPPAPAADAPHICHLTESVQEDEADQGGGMSEAHVSQEKEESDTDKQFRKYKENMTTVQEEVESLKSNWNDKKRKRELDTKAAEDASKAAEEASKAAEDASKAAEDASKAAEEASKAAEEASKAAHEAHDKAAKSRRQAMKSQDDEASSEKRYQEKIRCCQLLQGVQSFKFQDVDCPICLVNNNPLII